MATTNDRTSPRTRQPDLDWAIATGFAYLRPGEWLPLLVQFNPHTALGETPAARWRWFVNSWVKSVGTSVQVPEAFASLPPERLEAAPLDVCVLYIRRESAARLVAGTDWQRHILRAELGPPLVALPLLDGWPKRKPGGAIHRVAMGVIDQGIAFAHPRFRSKAGTRIAAVWQQDRAIIDAPSINAVVANGSDEDTIYRKLGGLALHVSGYKPLAMRRAHGTQVLDLMAGYDPAVDQRARPIIAVDMPESAVGDPAGSLLTPYAAFGLLWIALFAEMLRAEGETLPVVVNLSYGPNEGPHDGSGLLERLMDHITQMFAGSETPLTVVVAAGNARQARLHAQAEIAVGGTQLLHWRLQPCGRTPSQSELWFDAGAKVEVTLTSPDGRAVKVNSQQSQDRWPAVGLAAVQADYSVQNSYVCVTLSTGATQADPESVVSTPVVPSGRWTLAIENKGTAPCTVRGWIRRSDTQAGRRAKGRQSYFDEESYSRFMDSGVPQLYDPAPPEVVRRAATLSGATAGHSTFVIGGYVDAVAQPARYSSQGPHFNPQRSRGAPDWLERSDDSLTCRGVLAAGNRAGAVTEMNGTSAAAPQAARRIADLIATTGSPLPPAAEFSPPAKHPIWPIPSAQVTDLTGKGLRALGAKRWPPRLRP